MREKLQTITHKIQTCRELLKNEEATKTSLVLPFIQSLGYDIFNPSEVIPEYTCDVGIKKGEKIDYAICKDGVPIILIECKSCAITELSNHFSQLYRYYAATSARIAILTNGIEYRFFADIERTNIMDTTPFLIINLLQLKDFDVCHLIMFNRNYFNIDYIIESIPFIKATSTIIERLQAEIHVLRREFNNTVQLKNTDIVELEKKYKLLQEKYEDTCRELSNRQQENSSNKSAAYQDLIDYLNMPVPYNWKTFTVQERLRYIHDKSIWQGSPREFICTPEVSCEFYGYKREELNVRTGRIVSNAIRGTGLFVQDGTKKSFVHYGSNKAWIRKSK